jgi:hypothetical protein
VRTRGGDHLSGSVALRVLLAASMLGGCARAIHDSLGEEGADDGGMDAGMDGGRFGNADPGALDDLRDAAAFAASDAFFVNDPPPMYCGPDDERPPEEPGGTASCPDDKNREGCPCPEVGMQAACWPGKRIHRNHGVCRDGQTVCTQSAEFGRIWGPCEGYVLPAEGALAGPEACGCFSSGTWNIENMVPCILRAPSGKTYLYSSKPGGEFADCGANVPEPPPLPDADWSENSLQVDCAGQLELCFRIRAGDIEHVTPDDCVVMEHCVDVWYPQAGVVQLLPPIPAWTSSDAGCAARFDPSRGIGYAEMSVLGQTIECGVIDDGNGQPYVFLRTKYCAPECGLTPDAPECSSCGVGASGMFGP